MSARHFAHSDAPFSTGKTHCYQSRVEPPHLDCSSTSSIPISSPELKLFSSPSPSPSLSTSTSTSTFSLFGVIPNSDSQKILGHSSRSSNSDASSSDLASNFAEPASTLPMTSSQATATSGVHHPHESEKEIERENDVVKSFQLHLQQLRSNDRKANQKLDDQTDFRCHPAGIKPTQSDLEQNRPSNLYTKSNPSMKKQPRSLIPTLSSVSTSKILTQTQSLSKLIVQKHDPVTAVEPNSGNSETQRGFVSTVSSSSLTLTRSTLVEHAQVSFTPANELDHTGLRSKMDCNLKSKTPHHNDLETPSESLSSSPGAARFTSIPSPSTSSSLLQAPNLSQSVSTTAIPRTSASFDSTSCSASSSASSHCAPNSTSIQSQLTSSLSDRDQILLLSAALQVSHQNTQKMKREWDEAQQEMQKLRSQLQIERERQPNDSYTLTNDTKWESFKQANRDELDRNSLQFDWILDALSDVEKRL